MSRTTLAEGVAPAAARTDRRAGGGPALGGIPSGLLEKDEYLTDALRALFALRLDSMHLAFCGNTPWTGENGSNAHPISFSSTIPPLVCSRVAGGLRRGGLRLSTTGPTRGTSAIEGHRQS